MCDNIFPGMQLPRCPLSSAVWLHRHADVSISAPGPNIDTSGLPRDIQPTGFSAAESFSSEPQ
jgi:hypothetical protein